MNSKINKGSALARCLAAEEITSDQRKFINEIKREIEEIDVLVGEKLKEIDKKLKSTKFREIIGVVAEPGDVDTIQKNFHSRVANFGGLRNYYNRFKRFFEGAYINDDSK